MSCTDTEIDDQNTGTPMTYWTARKRKTGHKLRLSDALRVVFLIENNFNNGTIRFNLAVSILFLLHCTALRRPLSIPPRDRECTTVRCKCRSWISMCVCSNWNGSSCERRLVQAQEWPVLAVLCAAWRQATVYSAYSSLSLARPILQRIHSLVPGPTWSRVFSCANTAKI